MLVLLFPFAVLAVAVTLDVAAAVVAFAVVNDVTVHVEFEVSVSAFGRKLRKLLLNDRMNDQEIIRNLI